jgi:uncharacterized repeat protein (TIGR01451 family)
VTEHLLRARRGIAVAALALLGLAAPERLRAQCSADVSVVKTGPPEASAGGTITYDVTITNNGPDAATGVVMTDSVPTNTTFVSFSTGASGVPCVTPPVGDIGKVICTFPSNIGVGVSYPFLMEVKVNSDDVAPVVNTASVTTTCEDEVSSDNSSTATVLIASDVPLSGAALALLGLSVAAAGIVALRR